MITCAMKTAIITGASQGIGLAIARRFAEEGFNIATCGRRVDKLAELKKQLSPASGQVFTMQADLSVPDQCRAFGDFACKELGDVRVLINNVGNYVTGTVQSEPDGLLESQFATNVGSAYHLTRSILPNMIAQQEGHVFNVCSIASLGPHPAACSYTISKFAMLGFSKALREELKTEGIRVTSLMPGAVLTPSWEGYDGPSERLMKSEDIAALTWAIYSLSNNTVVEDVVLQPQLGPL